MMAFLKKEWMELCRSGRLLVLLFLFSLFGIMNPALAKLTPWLIEALSESLAQAGIAAVSVTVDAMSSWTQFYKNIPLGMVLFILLCGGSFTTEYQKGTLIPVVTRGLSRRKIVMAKSLLLFALWTVMYWLCFGITFGYNAYFWDNGIADNLYFAAALTWLFGVWITAFFLFFSAAAHSSTQALTATGAIVMGVYLLSMFPRFGRFLPIKLMDGMSLLQGAASYEDYSVSIAAAVFLIFLCIIAAVIFFERKRL